MNKLVLKNSQIMLSELDSSIELKEEKVSSILKLEINVLKDTSLMIEYQNSSISKYDIKMIINENVQFDLYEKKQEEDTKIQYLYEILESAQVQVHRFQQIKKIKELDIIYLNGYQSSICYETKAISLDKQKYDMVIYHNATNSKSDIVNRFVALEEGNIHLNITSIVYPGIKDTIINQNNRILNLNEKSHTICPNLLIEENEVDASHSAHIGSFDEDALFYMMSRGLSKKEAIYLLLEGFLKEDFLEKKELQQIISQYWR